MVPGRISWVREKTRSPAVGRSRKGRSVHSWESAPLKRMSAPVITHAATASARVSAVPDAPIPEDPIITVAIALSADIATAREAGRDYAIMLGFSPTDVTMISTAISEVARNIISYAGNGEIRLLLAEVQRRRALVVQARDEGPGIADIVSALGHGCAPGRRQGLGLPGARRLMDGLSIDTAPGQGTTVEMWKWTPISFRRGGFSRSVR